jgi:broad specificity phosphatase PhoE
VSGEEGAPDEATAPLVALESSEAHLIAPLTIVFVRHGVTDMTVTHNFSGGQVAGPSLNAAGRVQAAKAADAVYSIGRKSWTKLPRVSRVLASPLTRTQETGAAVARRLGLHVETEPLLREVGFGHWEGLTAEQIVLQDGDAVHRWRFGEIPAPGGGESFGDVGARLDEALRGLAAEHARLSAAGDDVGRAWSAVAHAVAIKCAVGVSLGIDKRSWGAMWPEPASLTILQLRVSREGDIVERHLMCLGAPTH